MKRILMLLLTAVFLIGAAVPDADARGYRHRRRSSHRFRRGRRVRSRRIRAFPRFVTITGGLLQDDSVVTEENNQVFAKDDRRRTEAYLRELRAKERARRRRK